MDVESRTVEDGDKSENSCLEGTSEAQPPRNMEVDTSLKEQNEENMSQDDEVNSSLSQINTSFDAGNQMTIPQNEDSNQFLNIVPTTDYAPLGTKSDDKPDVPTSSVETEASDLNQTPSENPAPESVPMTGKANYT